MSTRGGVWKALERAADIGCQSVQIFLKSNMQWQGKPFTSESIQRFRAVWQEQVFHWVFAHSGYLINLASPPSSNRQKSIDSLTQEVELAESLELPFLVLHPGSHLGEGEETGLERAAEGLDQVLNATTGCGVRIALENTAGQGTNLGYRLSHLAELYSRVHDPDRLAICLDTAHLFAAGYDLNGGDGWRTVWAELEEGPGLDQVVAFHLNDSKTDLGSRVDRHDHIGEGKMGPDPFRRLLHDSRFRDLPGCLETPKSEDMREDIMNLKVLRKLAEEELES